jgi:hypothetical protein
MTCYISIAVPERVPTDHPMWRTTFLSSDPVTFELTGDYVSVIRFYRWKWLAKLAARWHVYHSPPETRPGASVDRAARRSRHILVQCRSAKLARLFSS